MTRLWNNGRPIRVYCSATGQPTRFTWQDRTYRIQHIRQQWQVDTDWWSTAGRIWRHYLAVTTQEGLLCVLYQDLYTAQWYLTKAYD